MSLDGALGWSSSYMKEGLAAFLIVLMDREEIPEGGIAMLSKIVHSVTDMTEGYAQGIFGKINETDIEYFWKCFNRLKVLHPMTENNQKIYLEWAETLIKKRVDGIMKGNYRNYYHECAQYIAALGEVQESMGTINGKQALMLEYKQKYSRRSAFHKDLRACGMRDGH